MFALSLFTISAIAVAVPAALLVAWALLHDWLRTRRRPQRRRCPRCWHDMQGIEGIVCPECGRSARHERRLRRSRRRWRFAGAGLVVLAAVAFLSADRRLHLIDWMRVIPSFALVELVDDPGPTPEPRSISFSTAPPPAPGAGKDPPLSERLKVELWRRYEAGTLSTRQRRVVIRRQFAAGWCRINLHTRSRWPSDVPLEVRLGGSFAGPHARILQATPRLPDAVPVVLVSDGTHRPSRIMESDETQASVGHLPAGTTEVVFDMVIREGGAELWRGIERVAVSAVATMDEAIEPFRSAAHDRWITTEIRDGVRLMEEHLLWLPWPAEDETPRAIHVELLAGDRTIAVGSAYAFEPWRRGMEVRLEPIDADQPVAPDAPLRARIRGDGPRSLRDLDAARYWAGAIEVPVSSAPP